VELRAGINETFRRVISIRTIHPIVPEGKSITKFTLIIRGTIATWTCGNWPRGVDKPGPHHRLRRIRQGLMGMRMTSSWLKKNVDAFRIIAAIKA